MEVIFTKSVVFLIFIFEIDSIMGPWPAREYVECVNISEQEGVYCSIAKQYERISFISRISFIKERDARYYTTSDLNITGIVETIPNEYIAVQISWYFW